MVIPSPIDISCPMLPLETMGFVGDSTVGIDSLLFDWLVEWWESQQKN